MRHTPEHFLASTVPRCDALAYDRRQRNRRPVFALTEHLVLLFDGHWRARREWRGVGSELIASEDVSWHAGLTESNGELPSIAETTHARCIDSGCHTTLRSHKTSAVSRERVLSLPHQAVTLGSLPLLVAQHWTPLLFGVPLPASYLVLQVQRAAPQ
ncbi:MAG: hypothetical protein C0497_05490 [Gemmatimonas sp.]|nr:hypothetical protein [Gemmatimonas sp.]